MKQKLILEERHREVNRDLVCAGREQGSGIRRAANEQALIKPLRPTYEIDVSHLKKDHTLIRSYETKAIIL